MQTLAQAIWKWFRYILTDKNDEWSITLLIWIAAVIIFLYKGAVAPSPFDFTGFGVGAAGVFGAGQALDWFTKSKDKTGGHDVGTQHD